MWNICKKRDFANVQNGTKSSVRWVFEDMNLFGVWKRRAIAFYKASLPKIYLSIFFTLQKLEVGPFMRSPTSVLSKGIFKGLSCDQDTARLYVPYMPPSSMRFSPSSYIVALVSLVKDPCLVLTTLHRWCWGLAWGWAEFLAILACFLGLWNLYR